MNGPMVFLFGFNDPARPTMIEGDLASHKPCLLDFIYHCGSSNLNHLGYRGIMPTKVSEETTFPFCAWSLVSLGLAEIQLEGLMVAFIPKVPWLGGISLKNLGCLENSSLHSRTASFSTLDLPWDS
ncbi:hypothetical protein VNO77_34146 [Canavalia gladiata]|uniref:Uncharacterized protein n=1 Tax=Canavalia gladiata TaxID=3824 RepID=A0AAN9PZJ5_CANGL